MFKRVTTFSKFVAREPCFHVQCINCFLGSHWNTQFITRFEKNLDETVREVGAELLAVTAVDFGRDTALVEFACCLGKWHWLAG